MGNEYNILIEKLDDFIRKYYRNQVVRGILLTLFIGGAYYVFVSLLEYFGHFSVIIRTIIFYCTIALYLAVLVKFIIYPVLQFFRIGRIITHRQAANIISRHFAGMNDKLLNTLELASQEKPAGISHQLVIASINQRIRQIKPIPFPQAINARKNFRYARFLAGLILVVGLLLIFNSALLTEGAARIVKFDSYYAPAAPFRFILINDSLKVQKGSSLDVLVEVQGKYVPDAVSIEYGGNSFIMKKESKTRFIYSFNGINNSLDFLFSAEEFSSGKYHLEVIPAPLIFDFEIFIDVPEYTGEKDRMQKNIGDMSIPCGSRVKWSFNTKNTDKLFLLFNDSSKQEAAVSSEGFTADRKLFSSSQYKISVVNKFFSKNDLLRYNINVIPDLYPTINIRSVKDSSRLTVFYFNGLVNDDYGFRQLTFNYKSEELHDSLVSINIPVNKNLNSQEFFYAFDFNSISATSGNIEYYFEVWDNDGVNGSKSSRSAIYDFRLPSKEDIQNLENEANSDIEKKLKESMKLADEIKKDISKMQKDLINSNTSQWEQSKMLEQINKKQNMLEQLVNELSEQNQQKNQLFTNPDEKNDQLIEKQKKIEELMENLLSPEIKKLMEEFNKLMEEFNKDKLNEMSENIKMSYEDLQKQLDKNLELLKRYEIEEKLNNTTEQLKELSKEQDQLSEETNKKLNDQKELSDKQLAQEEEFKKLTEDYKETLEKNKELQDPMNLKDFGQEMEDIKNSLQESSQQMKDGKPSKASKSQKETSKKMNDLAESMQNMMNSMSSEQNAEDEDQMRQIIDNLVKFSFDQEDLMTRINNMNVKDPKFIESVNKQKDISDDFAVIRDSIYALSKRVPQLGSVLNKEILAIRTNTGKTLDAMEERQLGSARMFQQYVMTSANNLALLLEEALKQMQAAAKKQCSGNGQCKKPGKGKMAMKELQGMQKSIKEQLESMIKQMKDGKGKDSKSMSKQLAQSLAQQQIFRQMLSQMINNGTLQGETMKKLEEIKRMIDQNEKEIVNKNITPITLQRQEQIMTRLLEAENSEFQRETDNKRESREAKNENFGNPEEIFQYKGIHSQFNELLKLSNVKLYKFYNNKYKEYLIKLNGGNQ